MSLNAYNLSAGMFVRGLTNLKTMLAKAEAQAAASASAEAALLNAQLATEAGGRGTSHHPRDLHLYSLALQVHWAAEGAKLSIERLLGAPSVPAPHDEKSLEDLHRRLDATIAYLSQISASDLEASLDGVIVIERPGGTVRCSGGQFLLEYAIPHFFYHVTAVYGTLRNHGVHLTMSDFLGNWGAS